MQNHKHILAPLGFRALIAGAIGGAVGLAIIVGASSCSQPQVACTVSPALPYAAKYTRTAGDDADGACAQLPGDLVGFGAYNARTTNSTGDVVPNLTDISIAIRTGYLGSQVAFAKDFVGEDTAEGHKPHAFGKFSGPVPTGDICTTAELSVAQQDVPEVPEDLGDPEDPDDDTPGQPATSVTETWSDVQVYVTAAALGTQVKAHYAITQDGCAAEYDVVAVFPEVFCTEVIPDEALAAATIESIDDNGPDGTVTVRTADAHGLIEGDTVEITGVDDDERSYDGVYVVASAPSTTEFVTAQIDPSDGDDPDPEGLAGSVQRLVEVANQDLCVATAQPEKGIPVGSGISPEFPVTCDVTLGLCVIDPTQDPDGEFPFLLPAGG